MSDIKFSIITASLNSERFIEHTIQSVANQTYEHKEHIVIDGGSSDNTLDILKKYDAIINWQSEPDEGIADAMNKGIDKASGDYLLFINADDYLIDERILQKISDLICDRLDLYVFRVIALYPSGKMVAMLNRSIGWMTHFKMGSCHQGQIISKNLFEKYGVFDTSLKINMDYDFILRIYLQGIDARSIDIPIAVMRQIGISARRDWLSLKQRFREEQSIHSKYAHGIGWKAIYSIYWMLYPLYRKALFYLK